MAVALRHVEAATHPLAGGPPDQLPAALRRLLPLLHEALRATAPAPRTRVGAMSAYHLGWTDAAGRPAGRGWGKFVRGCLALWAPSSAAAPPTTPCRRPPRWSGSTTSPWSTTTSRTATSNAATAPPSGSVWGSAQAINAGDGMHAIALPRAALRPRPPGGPAARRRRRQRRDHRGDRGPVPRPGARGPRRHLGGHLPAAGAWQDRRADRRSARGGRR